MPHPIINAEECTACEICIDACEHEVLGLVDSVVAVVKENACTACGDCLEECPVDAIEKIEEN